MSELKTFASEASADVRWAATIAMGLEQKAPSEWLLTPLTDIDGIVRNAAIKSIQMKSRQAKNSDLGPELKGLPGRYLIDEILDLLKNTDQRIAASAKQALTALSLPENPVAATITGEDGSEIVKDWPAWWIKRKDQHARKALELAKNMLELKDAAMRERTRDAANNRLRDIILHFPGTPSAAVAEQLLSKK